MKKLALLIPCLLALPACSNIQFFGYTLIDIDGESELAVIDDSKFGDSINTITIKDFHLNTGLPLITIKSGEEKSITINAPVALQDKVEITTASKTLNICAVMDEKYVTKQPVEITITGYTFSTINASNVELTCEGECLEGDNLAFDFSGASVGEITNIQGETVVSNVSGASKLVLRTVNCTDAKFSASGASTLYAFTLNIDTLKIILSGASTATSTGTISEECKLSVSGASSYFGDALNCKKVVATVSGASQANVKVVESLTIDVSGASTVVYYGTTETEVKKNVTGGSKVVSKTN